MEHASLVPLEWLPQTFLSGSHVPTASSEQLSGVLPRQPELLHNAVYSERHFTLSAVAKPCDNWVSHKIPSYKVTGFQIPAPNAPSREANKQWPNVI